jgi:hypothetical protein
MATLIAEPARSEAQHTSRRWLAYATVSLALLLIFLIAHIGKIVFPYDDSYITLHSAQVLHQGFDPNYPGVPALSGETSAPFVGVVYLLLFTLPPLLALNVAGWIGVFLYGLGLVRLSFAVQLTPRQRSLLVFLGLLCAPVPIHWVNGLETSCALAAVTWTLAYATGTRPRDAIAAGFLSGVSACVRPDLLPFALLITAFSAGKLLRTPSRSAQTWIRALAVVLAAAAPILLCSLWYLKTTGSPIPLTGIAKRYFFAEDHWSLFHRITEEARQVIAFAAVVGPLVLVLPRMARFALGKVLLVIMALFVVALFVQFPGEFKVNELRYPVVLVPLLLWGLAMMVARAQPEQRRNAQQLMYVSALYATGMLAVCLSYYRDEREFFEKGPHEVAVWSQAHIPPGSPILIHDAGYLAFSTHYRLIDFVGLKTPAAIPLNRQFTWPTAGRERALVVTKMATASGSQYLVLNLEWPPVTHLPRELTALGWKVDPLYGTGTYRIYRLTPPGASPQPGPAR